MTSEHCVCQVVCGVDSSGLSNLWYFVIPPITCGTQVGGREFFCSEIYAYVKGCIPQLCITVFAG